MKLEELMATVKDSITVGRVFAEPFEKDGVTLIVAAAVSGGAGGGGGHGPETQEGEGGGIGLRARPAGAYVVKDGVVQWRPAVDVNRIVTVVGLVVIVYLLTRARMEKIRARAADRS